MFLSSFLDEFEPFLREYFEAFKYKSIETKDFKEFFEKHFGENARIFEIDWQAWLYTPGMPPVIPDYNKILATAADNILSKFLDWDSQGLLPITQEEKNQLTTNQIIYILQEISIAEPQSIEKLKALNDLFNFDNVKNSEIKFRWLRTCIKAKWEEKVHTALTWVNIVGRMKFVRPLYRDLYQWEVTKNRTIENFKANRQHMMHVSQYTLAKDLQIES